MVVGENSLDFLNIFVEAPGDFIYFLVVVSLSLISLFMVWSQRDHLTHDRARQYSWALVGVVIGWALMFIGAVVATLTSQQPDELLPPLSRAVGTASILLIGWAFLTADHQRGRQVANRVMLGLLILLILGYMVTGVQWISLADDTEFNMSVYGIVWAVMPVVLSTAGIIFCVTLFRQVVDAPLKFVFFSVLFSGHSTTLYQTVQGIVRGNYPGASRLAMVAAMGLLTVVVYRMVIRSLQSDTRQMQAVAAPEPKPAPPQPRTQAVDHHSVQLLKSLGMILEHADPSRIPEQIVRTTLNIMQADVGAIIRIQDANYGDITMAYDRLMNRNPSGMSLNLDEHPTLVNAIERQRQRGLYPDRNKDELDDLYTRLDIEQRGAAYFQPLMHQKTVVAVLLIAFPYTGKELRPDEIELLKGLSIVSSSLLALSYEAQEANILAEERAIQAMVEGVTPSQLYDSDALIARQEMQENLKAARGQVANLSQQVMSLKMELDAERTRLTSLLGDSEAEMSISQQIRTIATEQESMREERDRLARRLQEAEAALNGATANDKEAVVNQQIDQLRREMQSLESERDRLRRQLDDLRAQDRTVMPENIQPLITKMIDDIDNLRSERDQLRDMLSMIETELHEMGIEDDTTGLAQLIHRLYDERATLSRENDVLRKEREMLLQERGKFAASIGEEKAREEQIQALQQEVEHLASDRETAIKQRDKLRGEIESLEDNLNRVKEHRARLLAQVAGFESEMSDVQDEQIQLQEKLQDLADEKSELANERDRLQAEKHTLQTERDQLLAQIEGDPSRLQKVNQEGVGALRQMVDDLSAERDRLERELNKAQHQLAQANARLEVAEITTVADGLMPTYQPQQPELLVGLVQELRTPMTSITGYVDLLLNESAGILGEMQRKFLHRVSANITRLDTMIDSLVNITELDTGTYRLRPRPVDVVKIVEDAITNASAQFREREMAVSLDIDDALPQIEADEDSMTQIVGQLLANAYLVSPQNSDIVVTVDSRPVRLDDARAPRDCLFISIEDRGGGISPEELPRVFARKYKADNPLIEGLGDTGVGMSIAKALVEAHGGRLWVDVKPGVGSVFNVAIPLDLALQVEDETF